MADKQISIMAATSGVNPEKLLESKIKDLKTNFSDAQLKQLLKDHGLDTMSLTAHTRSVVLKKLAQKILNLELTPNLPDLVPVKSQISSLGDAEPFKQESVHNDAADVCKTLKEVRESLSSCLNDSKKTHYVVCIPSLSNTIKVHSDFRDVLKLMKDHKNQNPRMLSFPSLAEAEAFANKHTANDVCQGTTIKSNYPQEKAEVELAELKLFPSLATPQLNEFRIFLEKGNINAAFDCILANPRYLVQSIDMPTIVKEGPRYNALHASVIAGQLESCRLVMEMISDVDYLKRLYEIQKRAEDNSKRLIDLYLNTPDKVANKTPLHLASERGYVDIVAFLVSFKVCIRNFNHHIHERVKKGEEQYDKVLSTGKTPEEVACSRYKGTNATSVKTRVVDLIRGGTCYVPLIRSDTTGPYAKVGDPYTPTSPYKLVTEIEGVLKPTPAANLDMDTKDFRSMKVWAFAGPMSPKEAEDFRKEWKSPRLARNSLSIRENLKVMDGDRGFERFGRELADNHSTSWQEYWPFLDAFADLRSEEGLDKLDLFFQKQKVINLMQTLLRKEDFVTAPPYHVSKDYILQDSSDSEASEEENEVYFSAESPSCSEEDGIDSSETCTLAAENAGNTSAVSPGKTSGGVLFSIWSGVLKVKNLFSPGFGKSRSNVSSIANTPVTNAESNVSKLSSDNSIDFRRSKGSAFSTSKHGSHLSDNNRSDLKAKTCSHNNQEHKVADFDTPETCVADPAKSASRHVDTAYSVQAGADSSSLLPSSPSSSKDLETADTEAKSKVQSSNAFSEHTQNNTHHVGSLSGTESLPTRTADAEISQTPDKWKYRIHMQSPESGSSSPEKEFFGSISPQNCSLDVVSPSSYAGSVVKMKDDLSCPQELTSSPKVSKAEAELDESFNTKMDIFSSGLKKFSILSPGTSPSVSTTTTPSSPSSKLDTDNEPSVHIFTGKSFSKLLSELKSRKFTDNTVVKCKDQILPTLFLRQSFDNNTVLADVFLPGKAGMDDTLSRSHGHILDETTHKEAVKNVWINFLVTFTTPSEAKRVASLSREEVVCVIIEGMTEDKDVGSINSYNKVDPGSLKELFLRSSDSLCEPKQSVTLVVRIVRSTTLPSRDVFVCGTIPTKVDADVYHTLNNRACQLIRKQPSRFSQVTCWYDKMSRQGKDSINSLPSPSRVLRSERREPLPVSPLVGTPLRSNTRHSAPGALMSAVMTGEGKQNESFVRNLFGQGHKNNNK